MSALPAADCTPFTEYDAAKDLIFYCEREEAGRILLRAGELTIAPSEDSHAPRGRTVARSQAPAPSKRS